MTKKHQALRDKGYEDCRKGKLLILPDSYTHSECSQYEIGWRARHNEEEKIRWAETIARLVREMNDKGIGLTN